MLKMTRATQEAADEEQRQELNGTVAQARQFLMHALHKLWSTGPRDVAIEEFVPGVTGAEYTAFVAQGESLDTYIRSLMNVPGVPLRLPVTNAEYREVGVSLMSALARRAVFNRVTAEETTRYTSTVQALTAVLAHLHGDDSPSPDREVVHPQRRIQDLLKIQASILPSIKWDEDVDEAVAFERFDDAARRALRDIRTCWASGPFTAAELENTARAIIRGLPKRVADYLNQQIEEHPQQSRLTPDVVLDTLRARYRDASAYYHHMRIYTDIINVQDLSEFGNPMEASIRITEAVNHLRKSGSYGREQFPEARISADYHRFLHRVSTNPNFNILQRAVSNIQRALNRGERVTMQEMAIEAMAVWHSSTAAYGRERAAHSSEQRITVLEEQEQRIDALEQKLAAFNASEAVVHSRDLPATYGLSESERTFAAVEEHNARVMSNRQGKTWTRTCWFCHSPDHMLDQCNRCSPEQRIATRTKMRAELRQRYARFKGRGYRRGGPTGQASANVLADMPEHDDDLFFLGSMSDGAYPYPSEITEA